MSAMDEELSIAKSRSILSTGVWAGDPPVPVVPVPVVPVVPVVPLLDVLVATLPPAPPEAPEPPPMTAVPVQAESAAAPKPKTVHESSRRMTISLS